MRGRAARFHRIAMPRGKLCHAFGADVRGFECGGVVRSGGQQQHDFWADAEFLAWSAAAELSGRNDATVVQSDRECNEFSGALAESARERSGRMPGTGVRQAEFFNLTLHFNSSHRCARKYGWGTVLDSPHENEADLLRRRVCA